MIFALVGNQNCGKTTLFNQLTGANQHVGNFPGVTVDSKSGNIRGRKNCSVVDLPGIYSIRPYTNEEIVTRDFIIDQKPDGIINIVDATNIERNLYLTLQLAVMNLPMVIALNMMDEVRANGGSVNVKKLSARLGVPVVPISAAKNEGIDELIETAITAVKQNIHPTVRDFCDGGPVHRCIHAVSHQIEDHAIEVGLSPRFAATKLIEGDGDIIERLVLSQNELDLVEHSIVEMETDEGLDRNAAIAAMRYRFIENACRDTVERPYESREYRRSVAIDKILTGKYTAIPCFLGIMAIIFYLTFGPIGGTLSTLFENGIAWLTDVTDAALAAYGINQTVHSLIIDGVFGGIGSVLSFLPTIVVLFFFLSILEDTGYMARVAFVMDKLLRKIGLSGRSFVPMLIGFGCSVPAIMATRTLSSERDRLMTVMLTPFMSCSAKIPIYVFFAATFFRGYEVLAMIALYVTGILVGILVALLFRFTKFRGKPVPFVMELPNYRLPSAKSVLMLMWEKAKDFLQKAFTLIFVAAVVIWFLQSFDARFNVVSDSADSMLAYIGRLLAPLFAPLGFGDWRAATALISGVTAKEAVVSTIEVLLGGSALSTIFPTVLSSVSFLVFTLLYTPCFAAIATVKRETGSIKTTAGIILLQCGVAWLCSFAVYRIGLMIL